MSKIKQPSQTKTRGSVLVLAVVGILVLTLLGLSLLRIAFGARLHAIRVKQQAVALLTAEAGYERALVQMGQEKDLVTAISNAPGGVIRGTVDFKNSKADYEIRAYTFFGARPIYRVKSGGRCGRSGRIIDVLVSQNVSGAWEMNECRAPNSPQTTRQVPFYSGDIIDMPLHINCQDKPDDVFRDIGISGNPRFLRPVSMGESRYDRRDRNKYEGVDGLFEGGIYFNQPDRKIADHESLVAKVARFKSDSSFVYKPYQEATVSDAVPAVQLEFYVDGDSGKGMVKVFENCTVKLTSGGKWDYKVGSGDAPYEKAPIYAYHYVRRSERRGRVYEIEDTYVRQSLGKDKSEPGGQIYVKGNVIIGGQVPSVLKGRLTVVATGNIWIANSVQYDNTGTSRLSAEDLPTDDNPSALGLISCDGVVKVIDPGLSAAGGTGPPDMKNAGLMYREAGLLDQLGSESYERVLPEPMVVEAAIIAGGGGWGMENAESRKVRADMQPSHLVVHGSITEAVRGVVGPDYHKCYYFDQRLSNGLPPGDIWLYTKYVPIPGGWSDYRADSAH